MFQFKNNSFLTFILTVDTLRSTFEAFRGAREIDFGDIQGKRIRISITH